jgi:hypothetical protein
MEFLEICNSTLILSWSSSHQCNDGGNNFFSSSSTTDIDSYPPSSSFVMVATVFIPLNQYNRQELKRFQRFESKIQRNSSSTSSSSSYSSVTSNYSFASLHSLIGTIVHVHLRKDGNGDLDGEERKGEVGIFTRFLSGGIILFKKDTNSEMFLPLRSISRLTPIQETSSASASTSSSASTSGASSGSEVRGLGLSEEQVVFIGGEDKRTGEGRSEEEEFLRSLELPTGLRVLDCITGSFPSPSLRSSFPLLHSILLSPSSYSLHS